MAFQAAGEARTIILTGGSSGIGLAAATAILSNEHGPWHLALPVRDAARTGGREIARFLIGADAGISPYATLSPRTATLR